MPSMYISPTLGRPYNPVGIIFQSIFPKFGPTILNKLVPKAKVEQDIQVFRV